MTTDEAIAAIPAGWRIYTIDMSIIGRISVMLRQIDHIGYVSAYAATLPDAIVAVIAKAEWHHRGWNIEPSYSGYEATHPDFDAWLEGGSWVSNGLRVYGATVKAVRAEIDVKEDKR